VLRKANPDVLSKHTASLEVVAMGAKPAIKEDGLSIPQDITIVGFNDIPLAEHFYPPFTAIRLPAFDLGWTVGDRLIRLIYEGRGLIKNASSCTRNR